MSLNLKNAHFDNMILLNITKCHYFLVTDAFHEAKAWLVH